MRLSSWALTKKLCILSVGRLGHPLVICDVSSGSPQAAERRAREKPCRLSIDSIAEVTYRPRFLLNAYEERHKANYKGTADLKLYTYQDSSVATSHCQRENSYDTTLSANPGLLVFSTVIPSSASPNCLSIYPILFTGNLTLNYPVLT